jgi:hypothetical protein
MFGRCLKTRFVSRLAPHENEFATSICSDAVWGGCLDVKDVGRECHHGGILLAGLVPTHDRLAHPAPAIIPSVSGGEARYQVAGLGRSWSAAPH